jgi:prepilin-type N-terminal cleavage/methylation domain-containing protein
MRRSDAGFTLLEVMAAVAVVAIVFTTLARVANQGLQSEGISRRRMEASLMADATLAAIEADIAAGVAPELGQTESEEEIFDVVVDVTEFDLADAIPAAEETLGDTAEIDLFRGSDVGAGESPVRKIEISVLWDEGFDEYLVRRTTFAIDPAAIEIAAGFALVSPANPAVPGAGSGTTTQ